MTMLKVVLPNKPAPADPTLVVGNFYLNKNTRVIYFAGYSSMKEIQLFNLKTGHRFSNNGFDGRAAEFEEISSITIEVK